MGARWKRFRSEDGGTWATVEEWPAGDERTILVHNTCDGFHVWRRGDDYTPPGTYWRSMPAKPKRPT